MLLKKVKKFKKERNKQNGKGKLTRLVERKKGKGRAFAEEEELGAIQAGDDWGGPGLGKCQGSDTYDVNVKMKTLR